MAMHVNATLLDGLLARGGLQHPNLHLRVLKIWKRLRQSQKTMHLPKYSKPRKTIAPFSEIDHLVMNLVTWDIVMSGLEAHRSEQVKKNHLNPNWLRMIGSRS